jgi:phosphatidylethanolamine/phosphatidyl-N-methylethanolamine N-methyltransferase
MQSMSPQNIKDAYRRYAPLYDYIFGAILEPGRKALAEEASAQSPNAILEVGVGTGLTLPLYPLQARLVGIDLSREMLAHAHEKALQLESREISLHEMNAEDMSFPDGSFDCVTLPYVLSATPNPDRLVSELRRVCKRNGTIIILNHFSGSRIWWLLERGVKSIAERVGFRSDFRFEEQILTHGWTVESVRSVNFMGLSKLVVIRNT